VGLSLAFIIRWAACNRTKVNLYKPTKKVSVNGIDIKNAEQS